MDIAIKIACRTIKRRLDNGEVFDAIIKDYPKLTKIQIREIKNELEIE